AVVAVERMSGELIAHWHFARPVGGVDEEQILVAVVIEIKKGHAPAHCLRQEFVSIRSVVVDKFEASGCRDVVEFGIRHISSSLTDDWRGKLCHLRRTLCRFPLRDVKANPNPSDEHDESYQGPTECFADD